MTRTVTWSAPSGGVAVAGYFLLRYSPLWDAWYVVRDGAPTPDTVPAAGYDFESDPENLLITGKLSAVDANSRGAYRYQVLAQLSSGATVPVDDASPGVFDVHNSASDHRVVAPPGFTYVDFALETSPDDIQEGVERANGGGLWQLEDGTWGRVNSAGGYFLLAPVGSEFEANPASIAICDDAIGSSALTNGTISEDGLPRMNAGLRWGCVFCMALPYQGYAKDPFFQAPKASIGILPFNVRFFSSRYEDARFEIRGNGIGIAAIGTKIGSVAGGEPWVYAANLDPEDLYPDHGDNPFSYTPTWSDVPGGRGWGGIRGYASLSSPDRHAGPGPILYDFDPVNHEVLFPLDTAAWNFNSWRYREINLTGKAIDQITAADNRDFFAIIKYNPPPEFAFPELYWRFRVIRAL